MKFIPYLNCDGNAEESIQFYADALGGKVLNISRYKDAPPDDLGFPLPDNYLDKVMHGALDVKGELIYFSDTFPGMQVTKGNHLEIHIACNTQKELERIFNKLQVDGEVTMPVDKVFWGSIFGAVTDKFGIGWSLEYELPQE